MTANSISSPENKYQRRHPEIRKANKPLMEKRRRARINQSLSILKTLVVDTNSKDKPSKLEKADILEMTVSYLQQRTQQNPEHRCFKEGYQECTKAVGKFLESYNIDQTILDRLIEFLKLCREDKVTANCETFVKGHENNFPTASGDTSSPSGTSTIPFNYNLKQVPLTAMEELTIRSSDLNKNASNNHLYPTVLIQERFRTNNFPSDLLNVLKMPIEIRSLRNDPVYITGFQKIPFQFSNQIIPTSLEDQPLDLCKYSGKVYGDESVWRPW